MKKLFSFILIIQSVFLLSSCLQKVPPYTITYVTIHSVKAVTTYSDGKLAIVVFADSISREDKLFTPPAGMIELPPPILFRNLIEGVNIYTLYDFNENYEAQRNVNRILRLRPQCPDEIIYDENIDKLRFANEYFDFTEQATAEAVQFEVRGRLSDNPDEFVIRTNKLNLR